LALASSHAHERALEAATDRDIVIALSIVHLCKPPNDSLEGQTGIPVEERAPERRPVESPHGVELAGILLQSAELGSVQHAVEGCPRSVVASRVASHLDLLDARLVELVRALAAAVSRQELLAFGDLRRAACWTPTQPLRAGS